MNRDNAAQYIPLVQALAEGKTIQRHYEEDGWLDCDSSMTFSAAPKCYRVKPDPSPRPWTPEEVPVGAVIQRKGTKNRCLILAVLDCKPPQAVTQLTGQAGLDYILANFTMPDGSPCGVVV